MNAITALRILVKIRWQVKAEKYWWKLKLYPIYHPEQWVKNWQV